MRAIWLMNEAGGCEKGLGSGSVWGGSGSVSCVCVWGVGAACMLALSTTMIAAYGTYVPYLASTYSSPSLEPRYDR